MQPHAGVQVVIVGLAGHVGHGEVYRCTVGDGHCRGHRGNKDRQSGCKSLQHKEFNVSSVCTRSSVCFSIFASGDAQLIERQLDGLLLMLCVQRPCVSN